jgi:hypothetical protein
MGKSQADLQGQGDLAPRAVPLPGMSTVCHSWGELGRKAFLSCEVVDIR